MQEHDWLTGTDPRALLAALYPQRTLGSVQPQTRQARMYLLACARRQWDRLPHVCRVLVALAEMIADSSRRRDPLRARVAGIAAELMNSDGGDDDFRAAEAALDAANIASDLKMAHRSAGPPPTAPTPLEPDEWSNLARLVYLPFDMNTPAFHWVPPSLHSLELLREVYGNPYKRAPFHPSWRTSTVISLASQMYARGEFSAMPILADALQDAGCDSEDILDHCRHAGEHIRGCWVIDRVLKMQ